MENNVKLIIEKRNLSVPYEIFISILAFVAVAISVIDSSNSLHTRLANNIILAIFAIDYIARLAISKNKVVFLKNNILELIAILPINSIFRVFRIARLFKLIRLTKAIRILRIFTFSKKLHGNIKKFLKTNGFIYVIYLTLAVIWLGSVLLYIYEKGNVITSYEDALWMSFTTASLFGYEGIEHLSIAGKIIIAVLIVIGVYFTGMFTATTFTYFRDKKNVKQIEIENQNKIIDLSDMNDNQFNEILNYIDYIISK